MRLITGLLTVAFGIALLSQGKFQVGSNFPIGFVMHCIDKLTDERIKNPSTSTTSAASKNQQPKHQHLNINNTNKKQKQTNNKSTTSKRVTFHHESSGL